jgi:hypothetical protein
MYGGRVRLALATVLGVLLLAAGAQAALPTFSSNLVVPGKSIGGLSLGMSLAQAEEAWGQPDSCVGPLPNIPSWGCFYSAGPATEHAEFHGGPSGVVFVSIQSPWFQPSDQVYNGPLSSVHTARGIRLGSRAQSVRRTYPHAPYCAGLSAWFKLGTKTQIRSRRGRVDALSVGTAASLPDCSAGDL